MTNTDELTIAEVYARALLDLASAAGTADTIDREFSEFTAYVKIDPDFKAFVTSRVVDADQRQKSLDKMFEGRMSELLLNTLQVLNAKDRLNIVGHVEQRYHELFLQQRNIVEVHVTSAEPLSEALRIRLSQLMEDRTKSDVVLIERVEPAVIGGLVIRVGDEQIDMSVAQQLRRFRKALIEQAALQIQAKTVMFEGATNY